MKKNLYSKFVSLVALCLTCVLSLQPVTALAANTSVKETHALNVEMEDITSSDSTIQPLAHQSYYPTAGHNSGYFSGKTSSEATYSLPQGIMKISYCLSGGGTCYIRFYYGSSYVQTVELSANGATKNTSITLPLTGTYRVVVYYPNGSSNSEIIYAYNLYTD